MDTYTGTTNNDVVSGAIADIAATDTVNGNAGTADQLTLTTAGSLDFTVAGAGVTNFENLVLANGTNTIKLNQDINKTATNGNYTVITGGTGYDTLVLTNTAAQTVDLTKVTGIEQMNLSAGGAITFSGAGASGLILQSTTASEVINLGDFTNSITIAGNNTKSIVGGTGTDTVTALSTQAAAVTIDKVENYNGSSSADTVTLAAGSTTTVNFSGVEIVNAGTGAQTVNFGGSTTGVTYNNGLVNSGLDIVNLNASNAAVDTITFNDGAGGVGTAAAANRITVNGFTASQDKITLDSDQTTVALSGIQAISAAGNITIGTGAPSCLTVLNFDLGGAANVIGSSTDGTAILANLGTITVTANDKGYIVAYDAGNAYLYQYTDGGNTSLAASEITLIGTFNGVAVGAFGASTFTEAA